MDDNTFNTVAIESLCVQFDVECDKACDGRQAVSWVKQRYKTQKDAYKLILMDYSMPELGGVEAGMKIKKFMNKVLPKKDQSVICCITAYSGKKYEQQSRVAGMDFFLSKPIYKSGMQKLLIRVGLVESRDNQSI